MIESKAILYVEDDPNDVELTLAALAEHNLEKDIITVGDGAEALDYIYRRGVYENRSGPNPGLVLLDIKMPKISGLEVLQAIKSDARVKAVPVVLLTSSRQEQDIREGYDYGANAYVVKPVHFGEFIEAMKRVGAFWATVNEPPIGSKKMP